MLPMKKSNQNLQKAISVSYTLVGSILLFGGVGYILNNKLNNKFWLISGLVFGSVIGLYELYKQINKK